MVNTEEVQCIVEAMEEDFLKHPPRDEAAGVLPIRSVVTLYRAACDWLGREPKSVEVQRACVGYCPSEPVVDGFRGNVGRDAVDVVIEALRASGAQREASPQTQLVASDPKTVRIMVAAAVLNPLIVRFSHPGSISPGSRAVEARAALAWADSLIAEAEESLKPGPGRWNR